MDNDAIDKYHTYLQYEDEYGEDAESTENDYNEINKRETTWFFNNEKRASIVNRSIIILLALCVIVILTSGGYLIYRLYLQHLDDAVYDELAIIANQPSNIHMSQTQKPIKIEGYSAESGLAIPITTPSQFSYDDSSEHGFDLITVVEPTQTPESEYDRLKTYSKNFTRLLEINKNCVGWIEIKGTKINYPVVYSSDSQKYLNTGFDGNPNRNGTIYCTGGNGTNCQNLTLYGHSSVSSGAMFGCLGDYKSKRFYNKHSVICFSTPSGGDYTYTIFAAFTVNIKGRTFNYTQANFLNDTDFQTFVSTAKQLTEYDTGVNVPNGAHLLTLSTCEGGDKRMVVIGYRS